MKQIMAGAIILGESLAFLWVFSNILRFGSHFVNEPNRLILFSEIALFLSFLAFGIYLIVNKIRGGEEIKVLTKAGGK